MTRLRFATRAVLVLFVGVVGGAKAAPPGEGYVAVPGGRIFCARMDDGPGTPLIVIHGVPGAGSYSLKPFAALGDERPVIRYDQLGAVKADHPTPIPRSLPSSARCGSCRPSETHSACPKCNFWGSRGVAMLVEAYMGTHPNGVTSVTFLRPRVTTAQCEHDADSLIRTLPDSIQQAIATIEAQHTTDSPAYQVATQEYYRQFVFRKPQNIPGADTASNGDLVYRYMWGPSDFTSTGTLKTFDGTAWLKEITIPALFMAGEPDEATPAPTETFSRLVPNSRFIMIPQSSHVSQNDNPEFMLAKVREILRAAESGGK